MRKKLLLLLLAKNYFATTINPWRLLTQKMYLFIGVLAFIASSALLPSAAQAQTFKALPLDCGGHFSGFAQADNGRLYGYGDVFGAWRSDNGGDNWTYLNWGIPGGDIVGMGMAVQKNNADVVYYSTNDALWKSTNGGDSWTALLTDVGHNTPRWRGTSPILIRSNNPNEIWFAGPRKGLTGWLWRSTNGGTSWVKAGGSNFDSNEARTLHNVSTYANQIWVGSTNGLYVSTDGGNNFSLVGGSGRLSEVGMISRFTSGTFAGVGLVTRSNNNGGGISRITATDYGNSATYSVTDAATSSIHFGYPTGLQIFSDGSSSAWNTSGDRHGFSPAGNGGQTFGVRATTVNTNPVPIWTTAAQMAAKNHPDYGTDQVIEAVGNSNKWMITGGGAPMYSMDKGFSWQYFPNGGGLAAVKAYKAAVSRYDVNRMYIPASDIGSAIVTDGGNSGQATLSSNKTVNNLHNSLHIMEGPNSQDLVLAGNSQGENTNIFLKSSNGGSTWNVLNLSGTGLPLSRDGVTKSVMSLTNANDFVVALASDTDQQGTIIPGTINPGVWRTTNGGANFSQVNGLPSNISTGARYSPQSAFLERDAVQTNVRYFASRLVVNPGQSAGLYRSTDGGSNWSFVSHPSGSGAWIWGFSVDPIRGGNLWAATDWGGVKVSRDGGNTWNPTAQFFDSRHVSSCDGKVAIWGKAGGGSNPNLLWYSADDGATWTAQTTVARNFHGVQGLTVDRNGKIWVSWNSVTVVTPVTGPVTADTQAPTVPTGLSSSNVNATSFTLNWTASTDNVGVSQYEIFRGGTSLGTTANTNFNVTGLTASTTYSMTVRARDAAGNNSAQSSALSVTTIAPAGDTQAPTVPASLSSASVAQTSFTLNWTASTDNVGVSLYEIFRGGTSLGTTANTNFNVTGLTASTAYSMTVRARDAAGNNSAQSSALSVTTSAVSGGTFPIITSRGENTPNEGNIKAFDLDNNSKWLDFSATSFLQIQYASTSAFNQYVIVSGNDSPGRDPRNWTIQGSNNGTNWVTLNTQTNQTWTGRNQARTFSFSNSTAYSYYKMDITGNNGDGLIQLSELTYSIVSGGGGDTQAPTVPTSLSSSGVAQTSFTLNWAASTDNVGVSLYEVFRSGTSLGTTANTNFSVTGLTASTAYSMTVRARDAAGNNSAQSSALSVTTSAAAGGGGTGNVIMETWTNISGTLISNIPTGTTANTTATLTSLEIPSNNAENYGVRIRGFVIPTTTGSYTFYIASDDNGDFRLSTNDQPANATRIAFHTDWTGSREWNKYPSTQQSSARSLIAGVKYYFEALMKEGSGGDNLAIGWTGPGISTITVIGAANLDRFVTGAPTGDTQAPTVPSSLTSSNVAQTSFTLNWSASTDNVGVSLYEIFRDGTSLGTTFNTNFSVTGLTASTAYNMTVRARDAAGNNSGQSSALSVTTSAPAGGGGSTVIYEAENATRSGGVVNSTTYANFSGSAYVTGFQTNGASVQFAVNVASAGTYNVRMRYSNAAGPGYPISMYINGNKIGTEQLASNGSWTTWQDVTEPISLNAGNNTIVYQKDPDNNGGAYNIDYIAIPSTPGAIGSIKDKGLADATTGASSIKIYPNPATSSFNVATGGNAKITVTSLSGAVMQNVTAKDKLTTIDSSNWTPGVYIIHVESDSQSAVKKVLIAR